MTGKSSMSTNKRVQKLEDVVGLTDPLRNFKFYVVITGLISGEIGVMTIDGLQIVPGNAERQSVVLTRGVVPSNYTFYNWVKNPVERDVLVGVCRHPDNEEQQFHLWLKNAEPVKFRYSLLDAGANQLFTENLVLAYTDLEIAHT